MAIICDSYYIYSGFQKKTTICGSIIGGEVILYSQFPNLHVLVIDTGYQPSVVIFKLLRFILNLLYSILGKPSKKKNCVFYDIDIKGGWVPVSKPKPKFLFNNIWFHQKLLYSNWHKNRKTTENYHEKVLKIGWKWNCMEGNCDIHPLPQSLILDMLVNKH